MPPILLAPSVAVCLALAQFNGRLPGVSRALPETEKKQVRVLDFSGPVPPVAGRSRLPGARAGGMTGMPFMPRHSLPIQVVLRSVGTQPDRHGTRLLFEVRVENAGRETYRLPSMLDPIAHDDGRRGRRGLDFGLRIDDGHDIHTHIALTTYGSEDLAGSFAMIEPGESIITRFVTDLRSIIGPETKPVSSLRFSVFLREWWCADEEYVIEGVSEEAASSNWLTLKTR